MKKRDYAGAFSRQKTGLDSVSDEIFEIDLPPLPDTQEAQVVIEKEIVPSGAIVRMEDGTLACEGVLLTRVGAVIPNDTQLETWGVVGDTLLRAEGVLQWWLGDWMVYGLEALHIDRDAFAAHVGKHIHTLENYAWVARSVPYSLRRESLTFGHHMLVAGFEREEDKSAWLDAAVEHRWSIAQMRKAMHPQDPPALSDELPTDRSYRKRFNKMWRNLVKNGEISLDDIYAMRQWLDMLEHLKKG
jgi:hypothetical protein